jgi:hypothetical protein
MKRLRRVSVEVIRRELSLSVTRPLAANAGVRPDLPTADNPPSPASPFTSPKCRSCDSPTFVVPVAKGDLPAAIQKTLEQYGVHSQLTSTGDLVVCARSFEPHTGASDEDAAASTYPSAVESACSRKETSP